MNSEIKSRATRKQKEKNNFELQKNKASLIDLNGGRFRDHNKIERYKMNYGLFNGLLDVELYDDPLCFEIGNEEISFDYQSVSHYPLISQIGNAIVGEQQNRPFKPMIKDNTPTGQTQYKKELQSKLQSYVSNSLQQRRQQIQSTILQQSGITDMFSLTPEQQMELVMQVDTQLKKDTPKKIMDYMEFDFQTPTAKQAQRLLDVLVELHDIKYKDVQGFKHAVVTGEEYYYEGERNNQLVFEAVNPTYFDWGGSMDTEWSNEGTWAKREGWYTYEDITTRHAEYLSEKDLRELDFYHEPRGGMRDWQNFTSTFHKTVVNEFAGNKYLNNKYKDLNIRNKEGQKKMMQLYADVYGQDKIFGNRGNNDNRVGYNSLGIRESHVVWRDKRLLKKVKRQMPDGRLKTFYLDEHYVAQPQDEKVEKIWVDEVWETWIIGTWDQKFVNTRPIPHQYKSLSNPYNVDLPYYGKRYNTHDNVSRNVSLVELGKTYQKDFDLTMASLKHDMATNFGKKFTLLLSLKPEDWTWQQYMDSIRNSPFITLDIHKKGATSADMQFLKSVDMGKMADIAGKIQLLQTQRDGLARVMYFNDARLGAIGQYANQVNTESNQVASYNQTALFFEQHRKIVEKALTSFLDRGRQWFKERPDEAKKYFDDISLAELMTSTATSYRSMGVTLNNSPAELQKIGALKQQALPLIQNGASPQSVINLIFADTETEVRDIITKETAEIEKKRKEAQQIQQQQFQAQLQQQSENAAAQRELDYKMHTENNQTRILTTEIGSKVMANSQDIDKNNKSDLIQARELEIAQNDKEHEDEMELEYAKLRLKEKLGKVNL